MNALEGENSQSVLLTDPELNETLILGLKSDEFTYEVKRAEFQGKFTKRNILSKIAQLYDPNGYIAPVITSAKYLMQKLWQAKIEWDTTVSIELSNEWNAIWSEIKSLEQIRIP